MNVLSIVGACGGTGSTTLAAHVAAGIARQGVAVVAFDFSPANALRLHFGMPWEDRSGLASSWLAGEAWNDAAWHSALGIDFLPYGDPGDDGINTFETSFARPEHADWFDASIDALDMQEHGWIVSDVPWPFTPLRRQVLARSTAVLIVLAPDAASCARATSLPARLPSSSSAKVHFVINGYDARRTLDHDMLHWMRTRLQDRLLPQQIHRDEAVREALAARQTVYDYASSSQAAADLLHLSAWLHNHCQSAPAAR